MKRIDFVNNFSKRLHFSLENKGYFSSRSKGRVDISQLAKITGVSYQMARKYILGLAMPEYHIISIIAKWLEVSPSWLLFGEEEIIKQDKYKSKSLIEIESEFLGYILKKCVVLFPPIKESEKIMNFIAGIIYDASHLDADNKTVLKIIDMMLSSAIQLADIENEKRTNAGKY